MNVSTKQKDSQTEQESWLPRGEAGGEGMEWEFGVRRYKFLYMEWINNKILLYSTRSYTQYPVIKP